ncbi:hypothetical protein [Aquibacillus saliphilus]|uniref:hypothetical protein n=1 Tax=Aquibacillus saliphilus TaxID=1909422 RepID=UPI001CF00B2E|nr:hypothetical protein [Aquibacillus saliphilus]
MKLYKVVNGEWAGWYGTLEKYNRDKSRVKLSFDDTSSKEPFMIKWYEVDDVELHNYETV